MSAAAKKTPVTHCEGCKQRLGRQALALLAQAEREKRACVVTCAYCGKEVRYAPKQGWTL